MPVPVADSQLMSNTARFRRGHGHHRRHALDAGCAVGHGTRTVVTPSNLAFTCGSPHTKTTHAEDEPRAPGAKGPRRGAQRACGATSSPATRGELPDRFFGCQHAKKQRERRHGHDGRDTSTSHGPWKLETRNCGIANDTPATRMAGQMATMPRHPANAQISQNGTITEKNGSCRPTMALSSQQIEAGHALQRDDRRAERAERDRRGVGDERETRRGQRREAEADENGAGDRDRRAETGRALEERAERERDEQQLQPAIA